MEWLIPPNQYHQYHYHPHQNINNFTQDPHSETTTVMSSLPSISTISVSADNTENVQNVSKHLWLISQNNLLYLFPSFQHNRCNYYDLKQTGTKEQLFFLLYLWFFCYNFFSSCQLQKWISIYHPLCLHQHQLLSCQLSFCWLKNTNTHKQNHQFAMKNMMISPVLLVYPITHTSWLIEYLFLRTTVTFK